MASSKLRQTIDTIVGDIIANPNRAEELKRILQHRIEGADYTVPPRRHVSGHSASHDYEFDSMWDNVPV